MRPECVIVGGGISGLSAAYELQRRRVPFVLVEGSSHFGGLIRTEIEDEFVIDAGPDAILTQTPGGVGLCQELGVELLPVKTSGTFVARRGALRRLPEAGVFGIPIDWRGFARTRAFSTAGKIRMAAEYFIPPLRRADGSEDESIASFIGRRFGREAVQMIGNSLMAGIHSGSADRLSMRALFPQLLDLEERDGSVIRGIRRVFRQNAARRSPFVCVRGGTAVLVKALVAALPRERLMTCAEVRRLELGNLWRIHLSNGTCLESPSVLLATPPRVAAHLLHGGDCRLSSLCAQVRDVSLVTIALGYERQAVPHPLAGSGFVVPANERAHVTAVTWVTSKWSGRASDDRVLLRAFLGGARDPDAINRCDDALMRNVTDDFRRYMQISDPPLVARVFRWPHASVQLEVGHLNLMRDIDERLGRVPGLFLSAAGFRGVGIAHCIADARTQAARAAAYSKQVSQACAQMGAPL